MTNSPDQMITVGRIIRPHGHKGLVVVAPETDYPDERFEVGSELFVRRGDIESKVRILESREYRGRWVVALEGVETMNDAEALRGTNLRVPADELFELEDGTYYVHDLEGCDVVTQAGERVGRVSGVQFGSGAPLLQVTDDNGAEVLVPMVEGICQEIDPAGKRIVINPPPGLLEVNRRKS